MTKQYLLEVCKEHKLYRSPALNDKLYLNFKGFTRIENLEEYTGLRALFLEGNALDSIEGLPSLPELKCLYLQQNCIWQISHLEGVPNLDSLNISHNLIKRLENLAPACSKLTTLIATDNQLESVESIAHVAELQELNTLDLQNNNISDPAVLELLKKLPNLKCLYLKGNPVVSSMKNYRKSFIAALPNLGYLDERPVFEDERRMVNAWAVGGLDAEREERKAIKDEKERYDRANFEAMQEIRKAGWRRKRERLGLAPGDTDPDLEAMSDEEYVFEEDPPELVEARNRLAAYTARDGEEEDSDVASARRKFVQGGGEVKQGSWSSGPEGATENDGEIYLASVRHAQEELLNNGVAARPAASAKLGSCVIEEVLDDARPAPDNGVSSAGLGAELEELD